MTTDVEIYDSKVEALALALAGDANRDRADAKAVLMIDGAIAYLAARFGTRHAAEQLYRRADFWACLPERTGVGS